MSGQIEKLAAIAQWQAAVVTLPIGTTSDNFTAAGVNTGMHSLTAWEGYEVSFSFSEKVAVRAVATSSAAVATAADYPHQKDVDYTYVVTPETRYLSVFGLGTAGTLYTAKTTTVAMKIAGTEARFGDPADTAL